MVTPTCPPHPLEAKLPPSYHLGSARRPEKVHCTELSNTLYYRHINLPFCIAIKGVLKVQYVDIVVRELEF